MNVTAKNAKDSAPGSKVAIVGGGISGLVTAYELARAGMAFELFESSKRFGGIVETAYSDGFVLECGPDSWVTEKPWASELATELGLADEILPSNDSRRCTYLAMNGKLAPIPDGMRMMAPVQWAPLLNSPLFSWQAKLAYLREPRRAAELKQFASLRPEDESIAAFVRRHFGDEVTKTIAGPLLAGVFGGDVEELSARAVMPAFVKMEAEFGSLITALQSSRGTKAAQPIFSTLKNGLQTLIDRLVAVLPPESLHLDEPVRALSRNQTSAGVRLWQVVTPAGARTFSTVVLASPAHVTRDLLRHLGESGARMAGLLPQQASSAIIVALGFDADHAARMRIPRGFGFLVPPTAPVSQSVPAGSLLACTFVDQKFPGRVPRGGLLLRAFFGGQDAEALLESSDEALIRRSREQLARILGSLPEPREILVRRWPLSLPQYTVGHLERIAELETLAGAFPGLSMVGNGYQGVGLSDLVREGRTAARKIAASQGVPSISTAAAR